MVVFLRRQFLCQRRLLQTIHPSKQLEVTLLAPSKTAAIVQNLTEQVVLVVELYELFQKSVIRW